jgi:hypothetical protein
VNGRDAALGYSATAMAGRVLTSWRGLATGSALARA